MSKSKMLNYWESVKKEEIDNILKNIKNNANIKAGDLLSKIHVNPPYISKNKALEYLEDLKKDGKIKINTNNEVSLCQC